MATETKTRQQALKEGLVRYFSGVECKAGHNDERLTSSGVCVACNREKVKRWRTDNPEEYKRQKRRGAKARYIADPSAARLRSSLSHFKHREKRIAYSRQWKKRTGYKSSGPADYALKLSHNAKRRAKLLQAVPKWFGEFDLLVWREAAELCIMREAATGIRWSSDHMIPLLAKEACGLHAAENCQVIPATINSCKNNSMKLTEPFEWLLSCRY